MNKPTDGGMQSGSVHHLFKQQRQDAHNDNLLQGGDGSGTSGGMEARIAKLEAQMEHVLDDLRKLAPLPERTARIEERLNALPDKDWVGAKMRNWVGGGVAFLTLVTLASKLIHF